MSRQIQQLTYNSFSGGLITEASPLTFPDGASIDESNFELTKQGFRRRRLGLDSVSQEKVRLPLTEISPQDVTTFLWEDSGTTGTTYLVMVVKNEVLIYDVTSAAPGELLAYKTTITRPEGASVSMSSHRGQLVIASGAEKIKTIRPTGGTLFSEREGVLKIRDLVGLPDYTNPSSKIAGVDMRFSEGSRYRPDNNELYLKYPYYDPADGLERPDPREPTTEGYSFSSIRTVAENEVQSDGAVWWKYELLYGSGTPYFMGYPIDTFLVTKRQSAIDTRYKLSITFTKSFFKPNFQALSLSNPFLTQVGGGVTYETTLTESEYNTFLNVVSVLNLVEENDTFHPHIYNLWNQGWGEKRLGKTGTELRHPLNRFAEATRGTYSDGREFTKSPSLSDNINSVLYPDNQESSNRTADRFHAQDLVANPLGSFTAPMGKYIIDAMDRGVSRWKAFADDLFDKQVAFQNPPIMSREKTSVGAQTVAEYAGRVWYGGFANDTSGSTIGLSNKILYSQIGDEKLYECYQEADPTSKSDPDVVETDGGWVNIDAIDKVVRLVSTDTALLVFATNGVWVISGADGNMFSPLNSMVTKITDKGAINAQSIVAVDSNIVYWAEDGAYRLVAAGFAEYSLETLTKGTINNFISNLDREDLAGMSGAYDERLERIVWIIDGGRDSSSRRVLIYHLLFGCFTVNSYDRYQDQDLTTEILSVVKTPLYSVEQVFDNVIAGTDDVVAGTDDVVVDAFIRDGKKSRLFYLAVDYTEGQFSDIYFADEVREDFKDWGLIDAAAYMITGYVTGGDTSRTKTVPWLTVHCNRTEQNATFTGVENPSSCKVQAMWDWTNDPYANRWGKEFQAYRLPRPQIRGIGEPVAEGIQVVTTKNKIRGSGKVVSFKFSTEPDKDCQILGWSMFTGVNNNV